MKFYLSLFVLIAGFISCDPATCPPDDTVATFSFSDVTKNLTDYEDLLALVFKDSDDNEIILEQNEEFVDSFFLNCMFQPCTITLRDGQCLNGEFEDREAIFSSQDLEIDIKSYWRNNINQEDSLDLNYGEFISARFIKSNENILSGDFASNWRDLDNELLLFVNSHAERIESITLIDQTYADVYSQNDEIWFAANFGLIGFRLEGELYELKEIIR